MKNKLYFIAIFFLIILIPITSAFIATDGSKSYSEAELRQSRIANAIFFVFLGIALLIIIIIYLKLLKKHEKKRKKRK